MINTTASFLLETRNVLYVPPVRRRPLSSRANTNRIESNRIESMEWIKKRRRGIGTAIGLAGAAYWGFSYIKDKLVVWQQDAAETQASVDQ